MKEVTSAYEAGDLHTLLRIEMEWLAKEAQGETSRRTSTAIFRDGGEAGLRGRHQGDDRGLKDGVGTRACRE